MKIGILTYHRAENYGSALQAYALSSYLNRNGIDAEVIDFHTKSQDDIYKLFEKNSSLMSVARNIFTIFYYKDLISRKKKFSIFRSQYLPLSNEYISKKQLEKTNDIYDVFICGSDQIWNTRCADFSGAYLLDFVHDREKCISYAASMGTEVFDDKFVEDFKMNLNGFGQLSMREKVGCDIVSKIIGREIEEVPDPVFLLDKKEWQQLASNSKLHIKSKYIFCYFIGDVCNMRKFSQKLRKKTGFDLIVVNPNLRDMLYINKKFYNVGPIDFVYLLNHAEFVCTDSFHATAFSIILQKKFWVFTGEDNVSSKSRIDNILQKMNLLDRKMTKVQLQNFDIQKKIDFTKNKNNLLNYAEKGKSFIKRSLK